MLGKLDQTWVPIRQALLNLEAERVVPFDVPGHKYGRGNPRLAQFLGERRIRLGVGSVKPLDNLCHPISAIRKAGELVTDAFGAAYAFFMVNGITSVVQAMVLSTCRHGDRIVLPRNVHCSVINALILCGAMPVYVNPETDHRLGISLGMRLSAVGQAIHEHPKARAVLINNPTYYSTYLNLKTTTELTHQHGMLILTGETRGTRLYFGGDLPLCTMETGADMTSVSMHKSGDSLIQGSSLLVNDGVSAGYVRQIINLTQTTSGPYPLLSNLGIPRKKLATEGKGIFRQVMEVAKCAHGETNQTGDYYAYSRELINSNIAYDFDTTKLSINMLELDLVGIGVYDILRDEYDIRAEFDDLGNMLAYPSVGGRHRDLERLVGVPAEIHRDYKRDKTGMLRMEYISPIVVVVPQKAFYTGKETLPLAQDPRHIYSEFIMCYPLGIPILAPDELITGEILKYIKYTKEKGCFLVGSEDLSLGRLNVTREE